MNTKQLAILASEYYETKDDYWFTERYDSSKSFAENEVDMFIDWLEKKNENLGIYETKVEGFSYDNIHIRKYKGRLTIFFCRCDTIITTLELDAPDDDFDAQIDGISGEVTGNQIAR